MAALGGIGFTVSLFIAALAFTDETIATDAKAGILLAAVVATALGVAVLVATERRSQGDTSHPKG